MLPHATGFADRCKPLLPLKAISVVLKVLILPLLATPAVAEDAKSKEIELGRRIYMEGMLPSGSPLKGMRMENISVDGKAAACENCHRTSGMGSLEGNIVAPPISGRFLFATADNRPLAFVDTRAASNLTRAHAPYTEATLNKAVTQGVNVGGSKMNPLMPRYKLSNAETKALMAYLRQLSTELSPGVGTDSLEFATVVTPEVDAKEREVVVGMMQSIFRQRNASQEARSGQMKMPLDLVPRTPRGWNLSVWELKGAPETWAGQLKEFYQKKPVFALISGLGHSVWSPVDDFCQQQKLPCLLPSLDVVPDQPGFYTLYYSHGVALEAEVLAKQLRDKDDKTARRLVQIYRDDEAGRAGSTALSQALSNSNIKVEARKLAGLEAAQVEEAFKDVSDKDELMLWLPAANLAEIGKVIAKPKTGQTYVSGIMSKDSYAAVPKDWQASLRVVYPYELGEKRASNLASIRQWLKTWSVPMTNEPLQAEVFFNMLFLTDLVSQMLDNLHRDYMVERAEDMLSVGSNVSPYPHLSMSRGQRFASKGAYIAKLGENGVLTADSQWIVP